MKEKVQPLYKIVEEKIMVLLQEKPYSDGFYLPTELELMKRYNVSRHTIRKAMENLVIRHIVEREKGKGTRKILEEKSVVKTKLNDWRSLTDEMSSKGYTFSYGSKKIDILDSTDELKRIFSLNGDEKIVSLQRVGVDIVPIVSFVSYFNPILRLDNDKEFLEGKFRKLYEYLEKSYEVKIVKSEEEITAKMPSKEIRKKLNLSKDTPILCRKRLVYDDKNRLIEYNIGYYNSEKFSYNVSLEKS
ncbi:GntR family transcriptional regulator [Fusobacterium sp.]|uniref:GntR family transcriptional regulator n=1 Tax=Fusobacterium sp. TaxID=68766 RepID=UPI0025C2283F|nr:GntR family transcriptional regulator [Fusobacterium sp.]